MQSVLLLKFVLAVIFTEAITEVITKSEIFTPLRKFFFKKGRDSNISAWFHSLFDCGYCFSVWSGWLTAILFFREVQLVHGSIDWFIIGVVLHRLANLFHNIVDKIHGVT